MKLLNKSKIIIVGLFIFLGSIALKAEEIRLFDNTYLYGSVIGIKDNMLNIKLASGESKNVPLEEVIVIRFLGRIPLSLQTGSQEFRFVDGTRIRAMIDKNEGDTLFIKSYAAGNLSFDIAKLKGFVALPIAGFVGSKADEMVDRVEYKNGQNLDYVLTQNTALYRGLVSNFDRAMLMFDHEDLLMAKELKVTFLAATRLADSARVKNVPWDGSPQIRLWTRDGSVLLGKLEDIRFGKWIFKPRWGEVSLEIPVDEIMSSEIMGGRIQYLSQLEPSEVAEETLLAPSQPYRMDKNCQGGRLSIGGRRFPWGIGVHANSKLTFDLRKKFKQFEAEVGIDSLMGKRGSAVFTVLGDGKELYKSPIVKGGQPPLSIKNINTEGVEKLTLVVTDGGDLDMGDAANWVSARVIR